MTEQKDGPAKITDLSGLDSISTDLSGKNFQFSVREAK